MSRAPHLPSPSCSLLFHERVKRLPQLLFILFFSWLSGLSAALVAVVWLIPYQPFVSAPSVYNITSSDTALQTPLYITDLDARFLRIYDTSISSQYGLSSFLAKTPILSSDGWTVVYDPSYVDGAHRPWRAVDANGKEYNAIAAVFDEETGLVYVRFDGTDLKAISFAVPDATSFQHVFFDTIGEWHPTALSLDHSLLAAPSFSSDDIISSSFIRVSDSSYTVGSALVTVDGRLVGIVGEDGIVVSHSLIRYALVRLLDTGRIVYTYLPLEGYLVSDVRIDSFVKRQFGYALTRSTLSLLLAQDVVTHIDGTPLSPWLLQSQLILSPGTHILTVVRNGIVMDIPVDVLDTTRS